MPQDWGSFAQRAQPYVFEAIEAQSGVALVIAAASIPATASVGMLLIAATVVTGVGMVTSAGVSTVIRATGDEAQADQAKDVTSGVNPIGLPVTLAMTLSGADSDKAISAGATTFAAASTALQFSKAFKDLAEIGVTGGLATGARIQKSVRELTLGIAMGAHDIADKSRSESAVND